MLGVFGQMLMVMTLGLAATHIVGASYPRLEARYVAWMNIGVFACVLAAFIVLCMAFITDDFSIVSTYGNSDASMPLLYKIAAVWGHHEGALLLWVLYMSLWHMLDATLLPMPHQIRLFRTAHGVQITLIFVFVLILLTSSNPFEMIKDGDVIKNGLGLNPVLRDTLAMFHPPVLYGGYLSLSMAFSYCVGGLLCKSFPMQRITFWIAMGWAWLTAGIGLGSFWAYYELGWGGFWFWDPVENASLVPWLAASAYLHLAKSNSYNKLSLLVAMMSFLFVLLGTFLVRSGVLVSVHMFALDRVRGVTFFALFAVTGLLTLVLYAWRSCVLDDDQQRLSPQHHGQHQLLLKMSSMMFASIGLVIVFATIYPLLHEAITQDRLYLGAQYFNTALMPFVFLGMIGMLYMSKKRKMLVYGMSLALLCPGLFTVYQIMYAQHDMSQVMIWIAGALGIAIGCGMAISAFTGTGKNMCMKLSQSAFTGIGKNMCMKLSHVGAGLLVIGISAQAYSVQQHMILHEGQEFVFLQSKWLFKKVEALQRSDHQALIGQFTSDGMMDMSPEVKLFPDGQRTSETDLNVSWYGDYHMVMQPTLGAQNSYGVRMSFKPFISVMWMGVVLIVLSGVLYIRRAYRLVGL